MQHDSGLESEESRLKVDVKSIEEELESLRQQQAVQLQRREALEELLGKWLCILEAQEGLEVHGGARGPTVCGRLGCW